MTFDDLNMVTDMSKRSEQANHVVIDMTIVPELPKVLSTQEIVVYVPKASHTHAGIIKPSDTDFVFVDGYLRLKNKNFSNIDSISVNGKNVEPDTNKNVNIKVPTNTSDLLNDSNFATTNDIPDVPNWALQLNKPSYSYSEIKDKPTIPTQTSQLTNNSGFITIDDIPENVGGIDNYVKTTKTINSLAIGDTILKGDTIEFKIDINVLKNYFTNNTPKITYLYYVNKETNDGFRFDCYITKLNAVQYRLTIQINFLENENIIFIDRKSETISFNYLGSFPSTYSIPNIYKDITNLYIYYTSSEQSLSGKREDIENLGVTAQKTSIVQDTLVNNKDGEEESIDGYVKVKLDNKTNLPSRLVQIVDNKEKEIPINEEVDKKISELENKVNSSHVVDIKKFIINDSTWISEETLKNTVAPTEDKSSYIAKKDNELYYYTYRDIKTNVGFNIASSYFEEKTIEGKKVFTSDQESFNRHATALQLNRIPKDISSVSFDLYMKNVAVANTYFLPEIAFINEEGNKSFELQFSSWSSSFELKINSLFANQINVGMVLPYANGIFNERVTVSLKNGFLTVYLENNNKTITRILPTDYPIRELKDVTKINFGLRQATINEIIYPIPDDWGGFSNVVFEKTYWENSKKIQNNTLYVNLENNSLYRYVEDTTTKPYPNFIRVSSNQSGVTTSGAIESISVNGEPQTIYDKNVDIPVPTKMSDLTDNIGYVRWDEGKRITKDTIINTGDTVCINIDVNKLFSPDSLFQGILVLLAYDENTETIIYFFIAIHQIDDIVGIMWGYGDDLSNPVYNFHPLVSINDIRSFYAINYNGPSLKIYDGDEADEFPIETDCYNWTIGNKGFYQIVDGKVNNITIDTGADKDYIDQKAEELSKSININTQEIARVSNAVNDLATKNEVEELFNNLPEVAKTGKYVDLLDPPTIPTNTSELNNNGSDGVNKFATVNQIPYVHDWALQPNKPTYNYSDIQGTPTLPEEIADKDYVKDYVDTAIDNLIIEGAPEALDTLKELADAIANNQDLVGALNNAIGSKAAQSDVDAIDIKLTNFENGTTSVGSANTAEVANAIKVKNGTSTQYSFKVSTKIDDPGEVGCITFIIGSQL